MDDYLKMAGSLKESLANAEGFIRAERFSSLATEGKLLSMSVWKMRNVFQNGGTLPRTVWRKSTGEWMILQTTRSRL